MTIVKKGEEICVGLTSKSHDDHSELAVAYGRLNRTHALSERGNSPFIVLSVAGTGELYTWGWGK